MIKGENGMKGEIEKSLKKNREVELLHLGKVFHDVKVIGKDGKVKIIPAEDLKIQHWRKFQKSEKKIKNFSIGRKNESS